MALNKRTTASVPTQQTNSSHLSQSALYWEVSTPSGIANARQRVIGSVKAAVLALNAELLRLEATGNLVDTEIEKTYGALGFAVDRFREEQELAEIEASWPISDWDLVSGFNGGVAQ